MEPEVITPSTGGECPEGHLWAHSDDGEGLVPYPHIPTTGLWLACPWRGGDLAEIESVYWTEDGGNFAVRFAPVDGPDSANPVTRAAVLLREYGISGAKKRAEMHLRDPLKDLLFWTKVKEILAYY